MSPFFRFPGPSIRDHGRVGYAYFQIKIDKMTYKVDQGHWPWYNSLGSISLSVTGL